MNLKSFDTLFKCNEINFV